jgi:hypothetical protein
MHNQRKIKSFLKSFQMDLKIIAISLQGNVKVLVQIFTLVSPLKLFAFINQFLDSFSVRTNLLTVLENN